MEDAICEPLAAPAPRTGAADFEALYRRTFSRVYAYVASIVRDRAAAEDVTSLAYERAYRRRRLYSARRGTPEAWLFGIARNAALDELRRRGRGARLAAEPPEELAPAADELADAALRREVVRAALARLDARERELLALKFAGGLSNAEIARVLGVSESNAGTRLHRTLERLRRECREDR